MRDHGEPAVLAGGRGDTLPHHVDPIRQQHRGDQQHINATDHRHRGQEQAIRDRHRQRTARRAELGRVLDRG